MRFDRQKLRENCDFGVSAATPSQEMRFDRHKLWENCDFGVSAVTPFAPNEVRSSKTAVKLRSVRGNPFAPNEVRSSKTAVKLRFSMFRRDPF